MCGWTCTVRQKESRHIQSGNEASPVLVSDTNLMRGIQCLLFRNCLLFKICTYLGLKTLPFLERGGGAKGGVPMTTLVIPVVPALWSQVCHGQWNNGLSFIPQLNPKHFMEDYLRIFFICSVSSIEGMNMQLR